jgi:hypothetical protein
MGVPILRNARKSGSRKVSATDQMLEETQRRFSRIIPVAETVDRRLPIRLIDPLIRIEVSILIPGESPVHFSSDNGIIALFIPKGPVD